MAGSIEEHIQKARELLAEAEAEYQRAHHEVGLEVITAWRDAYEKGWLAVRHAANAFLLKEGLPHDRLPALGPDSDRQVNRLMADYTHRNDVMLGRFSGLWFEYHDRIYNFEDMPDLYFKRIREFIDMVEAAPLQEAASR